VYELCVSFSQDSRLLKGIITPNLVVTPSNIITFPPIEIHLVGWLFNSQNVGITIISIGTQLQIQGMLWLRSVMTCLLVAMYLFVIA